MKIIPMIRRCFTRPEADVSRACDPCQKGTTGSQKAPMVARPVVAEPFETNCLRFSRAIT